MLLLKPRQSCLIKLAINVSRSKEDAFGVGMTAGIAQLFAVRIAGKNARKKQSSAIGGVGRRVCVHNVEQTMKPKPFIVLIATKNAQRQLKNQTIAVRSVARKLKTGGVLNAKRKDEKGRSEKYVSGLSRDYAPAVVKILAPKTDDCVKVA